MVPFLLHEIRAVFGSSLAVAALQVHGLALSLLIIAWFVPILAPMFQRLTNKEPEIEWVSLWHCPRCGGYNRRSFTHCTHCEYSLKVGGAGKWIHDLYEWSQQKGQLGMRMYILTGRALFYGLTAFATVSLGLFHFKLNPLSEITASLTLIGLLLSMMFFYLALRPRYKPVLGAVLDFVAGVAIAGISGFCLLLWLEAIPATSLLAEIKTYSNKLIELRTPGGDVRQINAIPVGKSLKFDLQYVMLNWPIMGIQHVYLTRFSGNPISSKWMIELENVSATSRKQLPPYRLQLIAVQQFFEVNPNSAYLFQLVAGKGPILQPLSGKKFR